MPKPEGCTGVGQVRRWVRQQCKGDTMTLDCGVFAFKGDISRAVVAAAYRAAVANGWLQKVNRTTWRKT